MPDGDVFGDDPFNATVVDFVTKKQVIPDFRMIFLRGIGCNWLVCLACFFGIQGRSLASKVVGIWFPIFAFVSLGFDHVVANMTFIPLGALAARPVSPWVCTSGRGSSPHSWGTSSAVVSSLVSRHQILEFCSRN